MDSKTRKMEDTLITIGNGIILFAVWSLVRFVLSYFILGAEVDETASAEVKTASVVVLWVFTLLDVGVRLYVGYAARAEGLRRKKLPYLVLTIVYLVLYIISVAACVLALFTLSTGAGNLVVMLIIDITFLFFMLELLVSIIGVRKRRKQSTGNGGHYER